MENFPMSEQPKLAAISGPLRGSIFELHDSEVTIGRIEVADIVIDHKSVSRRHCVFHFNGETVQVEDAGSRNGTLVNGERVDTRTLAHGDRVAVGSSTFVLLMRDEDLSSLLSEIRFTEDAFDANASIELRQDQTTYLRAEETMADADIRTLRNFSALLQLGSTLQAEHRLVTLQEQALRLIMDAIPAHTGAIVMTGSRPDQFLSEYGRSREGSESLSVSRKVIAHVLTHKTALLTNDAPAAVPHSQTLAHSAARSVLCVPLLSSDRAFGAIYLASGEGLPDFDTTHLELLTGMAAMLTLPLESARRVDWLERENRRLQMDLDANRRLIGDSRAITQIHKFIARVAPTDSTVLIRGESGTGKELVAHAIHRASKRAGAPFVAINCAALKEELLESELFGHEKGAFTSAIALKRGKIEIADTGTVFLDEVAELAPELQVKLLRVLQEREFERVGGNKPIKVDIRVIAATDRDLEGAIKDGSFRHELYYRLNVVSVESPPLRQREGDVALLANYFAARYAERYGRHIRGISAEAEACLARYDWPGNVRELQNAIERAVVLGESDMIVPEDLPEAVIEAHAPPTDARMGFHDGVRAAKLRLIQDALEETQGNYAEAARLLGINRTYLHRLARNLDLSE
jgi:transcriptional regulator with GAF, ATPase, and Fis domain